MRIGIKLCAAIILIAIPASVFASVETGGGYVVHDQFNPTSAVMSGGGYNNFSFTELTQIPTDLCPNIAGIQSTIPSGMAVDGSGNCVAQSSPNANSSQSSSISSSGSVLNADTQNKNLETASTSVDQPLPSNSSVLTVGSGVDMLSSVNKARAVDAFNNADNKKTACCIEAAIDLNTKYLAFILVIISTILLILSAILKYRSRKE